MSTTKLLLCFIFVCYCSSISAFSSSVTGFFNSTSGEWILSNNYVRLTISTFAPSITTLYAAHSGSLPDASVPYSSASPSLFLASDVNAKRIGIVSEIIEKGGAIVASPDGATNYKINCQVNGSQAVAVISFNLQGDATTTVSVQWQITLSAGKHSFSFTSSYSGSVSASVIGVITSFYLSPASITGFFERGVVQMMNSYSKYFAASDSNIERLYTLGTLRGSVAFDQIVLKSAAAVTASVFLLSRSTSSTTSFQTGFQFVHYGNAASLDSWSGSQFSNTGAKAQTISSSLAVEVLANDLDFPPFQEFTIQSLDGSAQQQADDDLRAIMTSIFASSVGPLVSYLIPSLSSPSIATPDHAYSPLYNFFDPDNYFTVSGLIYSGLPFLLEQAIRNMMNSFIMMDRKTGQIPHHFIGDNQTVTFQAISGATQTGPNVFITLGALLYSRNAGKDGLTWLRANIATLELCVQYLLSQYDDKFQMISAQGALFIDVFIRTNFTADSNAAMVWLLREMIDAENYLGRSSQAQQYSTYEQNIVAAMQKYLIAASGDHFITQRNSDGSLRDFVDYDANLMAIALNIVEDDSINQKMMNRMSSGNCTRAHRPTYVSEIYYDAANCVQGNTGDSAVTMGRIAYLDAWAQITLNTQQSLTALSEQIIAPIMSDTFAWTWMWERYTCGGDPTHNEYFHEYAEMLVMVLREFAYGIRVGFQSITIDPALRSNFLYSLGGTAYVKHSPNAFEFRFSSGDNDTPRSVTITHLQSAANFQIVAKNNVSGQTVSTSCATDAAGVCQFNSPVDEDWIVSGIAAGKASATM